ncbi:MAG TPA: GLPGLI family protein [Flavobacteriia bacterium]|nr:GLPGLI family protein [Flavobacteriia bacterium]
MIRFIQQITVLLVLLTTTFLSAQDFQGRVYYQSKTKMDESAKKRMDTLKIPDDRKKMIQDMMKKMLNKSYILDFNKTASIFKEEEKLEQPTSGMSFRMPNDGVLYKDLTQKTYTKKKESFGKIFLIKDSLTKIDWKTEKESKQIGNYLAFKATAMVEEPKGFRFGRFRGKKEDKKETAESKTSKLVKLTVWYTPEIPVSNGPELYQGLPGLILEANIGRRQLIATKIVLNPKEKATITEPSKGKVVSQKEYDKIIAKKIEEMREMRRNRRKGDQGRRHGRF